MLAVTYRVRAEQKAEPRIEHPNDAIVRVTRSCIGGSDLPLYHGLVPGTRIGTTYPPAGLNGRIRHAAFRYSESEQRRWMMLFAAYRVSMLDGIREDLRRGTVPNLFAEADGRPAWRHDRAGTTRKLAVVGVATIGVGAWLWPRSRRGA